MITASGKKGVKSRSLSAKSANTGSSRRRALGHRRDPQLLPILPFVLLEQGPTWIWSG